ncbi:MAG: T9SS type A sorting domain-containing protein, partial [bacterium]
NSYAGGMQLSEGNLRVGCGQYVYYNPYFYETPFKGYIDDVMVFNYQCNPPWPQLQPPLLEITLTPYNPPIVIPPAGGSFGYNIDIDNNGSSAVTFDVWINIETPFGVQFPILGPFYDLTLSGGGSIERDRSVFVPGSAPAGEYTVWGAVGTYPWVAEDTSSFTFVKQGSSTDWLGPEGWFCTGEPFPGEIITGEASIAPTSFTLYPCNPNPFNASTMLTFTLPTAARVALSIYDITGRHSAALLDGYCDAGVHEVYFDASGLPSGIYFARLTIAGFIGQTGMSAPPPMVQKLVLLK